MVAEDAWSDPKRTSEAQYPNMDGYDLAAMIQEARPCARTVFGGVHVSVKE